MDTSKLSKNELEDLVKSLSKENEELKKRLKNSNSDDQTNFSNKYFSLYVEKDYFLKKLSEDLSRTDRYHLALSLCCIDIKSDNQSDFFNEKLKEEIQSSIREVDYFTFYNNSEIMVVFPNTSRIYAHLVSERIFNNINSITKNFKIRLDCKISLLEYKNETIIELFESLRKILNGDSDTKGILLK